MKTSSWPVVAAACLVLGGGCDKKASEEAPPAAEKPADEKPTDEKPADEKPTDTDEKPADEKPTAAGQTFDEALGVMCNAPKVLGFDKMGGSENAVKLAKYMQEKITNDQLMEMLRKAGSMAPETREKMFRDAIAKAGLKDCPLMDMAMK